MSNDTSPATIAPRSGRPATAPRRGKRIAGEPVRAKAIVWAAVTVLGIGVPFVASTYYTQILTHGVVVGMLALSIGWLLQKTGLLSFGHAAFFGLGAYTVTLTSLRWEVSAPVAILVAVLITTTFAIAIGAIIVRVSGIAFAMLTLGIGQLLYLYSTLNRDLTNGTDGLIASFRGNVFGVDAAMLTDPKSAWPLVWIALMLVVALLWAVGRTPHGRWLTAIRENEERARFSGAPTYWPKLAAYALSGAIAGIAGILSALTIGLVSPANLHWSTSGNALIYAMLGGTGTLWGPVVGGVSLTSLESALSGSTNYHAIIGLALILVVVFAPGGISGLATRSWSFLRKVTRRRSDA
ncbi:MAG: branched-chain amino acid ABC transporter permease [Actinobacteria bacterium]|uniref:branched-chain amino acid ABC transporter permease n=1 Tax=Microbacterium sp. NPDC076895 TaxID=3154957 RepID=UPI0010028FA9|nr:MAG: branched-chain amino acid ABC transporter permease [Actinomycetota bacterium]